MSPGIHHHAATACRDATFKDLQRRLVHLRLSVYEALAHHGPCTTRELARACDIDLLTVRPRVTELVQLGFTILVGHTPDNHEGIYQALTMAEAEALFNDQQQRLSEQLSLAL